MDKKLREKKKQFALELLINNHSNASVNGLLKKKFGQGLSNRDLKKMRTIIVKPKDAVVYMAAFRECYESLFTKKNKKEELVEKFRPLYWNVVKFQNLYCAPESIRLSDNFLIAAEVFNEIAQSKIEGREPNLKIWDGTDCVGIEKEERKK